MAKGKKTKIKWWWIVISIVAILFFVFYGFSKNNATKSQLSQTGYLAYQDPTYNFSIEYPQAWETRKDTQVFENGDAVAFGISGSTQKENTELTDGAQVAVSKPFSIDTDLATWVKGYFNPEAEFSQATLGKYPFETVYDCSNLGCMTYYFTQVNNNVYGVSAFAQGPNKEKAAYENSIIYMLKSLEFTNKTNGQTTKEQAIATVKALPEVIGYLQRVPTGLVTVNGEEDNTYMVQVYEFKNGHTATFNWYNVDKTTGAVEKQF